MKGLAERDPDLREQDPWDGSGGAPKVEQPDRNVPVSLLASPTSEFLPIVPID